jgi:hypothetical protein
MRLRLLAPVVALLALPAGAWAQVQAQSGPATAPSSGGAEYGAPTPRPPRPATRPGALSVGDFSVTPSTITPGGAPVSVAYRIDGAARRVRVRVDLVPAGARTVAARRHVGWKPVGVRRVNTWAVPAGLPAGEYVVRLHAVDDAGHTLARTAVASGKLPVKVVVAAAPAVNADGVFPVRGTYSFGGPDDRFGAERNGHVHQGQDILAAEGTPIASPVGGMVYWRAVQDSGAGHYLVIRGDDGRDYVFMHLVAGSETVAKGDAVTAGEIIGQVGQTGDAQGPHLHFEIWPNGWYEKDSQPIDPLPDLQAWAAAPSAP